MKSFAFLISIVLCCKCFCQLDTAENAARFPAFKAISNPFMPTITSDYFYFSRDGLMWFSTAQGLSSFDGSEVVNYSSQEQAYAFGLNRISTIAEDKDENLYIGGDTKLSYFNRKNKTFTHLSYQSKEAGDSFDISAHNIYIDTRWPGLYRSRFKRVAYLHPFIKKFSALQSCIRSIRLLG